jgi:hypothetical protein
MSFIVAAASTAAVSAISAGAITTGVTGAIAAGSVGAAVGGVAAGAATGAALGAGIGAAGAGITGGDAGEGALSGAVSGAVSGGIAPGLSGATAGLGPVGSGIVTGGVAGAAGSAAGAGATGRDAGEAALMGGGIGAVAGGLGGMGKADVAVSTEGTTNPKIDSASATTTKLSPDIPIGNNIEFTPPEIKYSPMAPGTGTVANVAPPAAPVAMSDRLDLASDAFKGGMSAVKAEPMRAASGLIGGLIEGADAGDYIEPEEKPKFKMRRGATMSKDYKPYHPAPTRYYPAPTRYYAEGGDIVSQQAVPAQDVKMNPFASMGVQAAQIGQQTYDQQQAQVQQAQQPQVQQGIVPPTPMPQPQMQQPQMQQPKFYADGGAINVGGQASFADQVRALASQKVQEYYAQQAQQLASQMPQGQMPQSPAQAVSAPAQPVQAAANGGIMQDNLGGYSHGGIAGLTRGPGDGVSDDIPAQIGDSGKQPARLADGEFVIPSRIVSELGNGSTEAGAKALQVMVDRVQARRSKTTGKGKIAVDSKATKNLPA